MIHVSMGGIWREMEIQNIHEIWSRKENMNHCAELTIEKKKTKA